MKHPAHFSEHIDKPGNELGWRLFQADLTFNAIVAQTVIGRAGHARVHAFIWQRAHHVDAVTYQYLVELAHIEFQACAAPIEDAGKLVWDGVLRVTGMEPDRRYAVSELPPDFREKSMELVAEVNQKALCALVRALKKKGIDLDPLFELADKDLKANFSEGHANTILNTLMNSKGMVEGWLVQTKPVLAGPDSDKDWPRL